MTNIGYKRKSRVEINGILYRKTNGAVNLSIKGPNVTRHNMLTNLTKQYINRFGSNLQPIWT